MEVVTKPVKVPKKEGVHYVNNKEFSQAVMDYVLSVRKAIAPHTSVADAIEAGYDSKIPRISEYIGRSFLRISEGLSHKPNFIRYTYREEMVMDAVENCIKAIMNYNIEAATRKGTPNAFAYFTQICYYAFIRRIQKEKKQQDIKMRYIEYAGVEDFMHQSEDGSQFVSGQENGFIDTLKKRIGKVKEVDKAVKEFKKAEKEGLENFIPE
jgi:hypothetical protein